MKLVIAIVRPEKLPDVQAALSTREATILSVSQVLGCGAEPGYREVYRGSVVHSRPTKLRLEVAVKDGGADDTVDAIVRAGASGTTGRLGDGEVFVVQMDECVRIGGEFSGVR